MVQRVDEYRTRWIGIGFLDPEEPDLNHINLKNKLKHRIAAVSLVCFLVDYQRGSSHSNIHVLTLAIGRDTNLQ